MPVTAMTEGEVGSHAGGTQQPLRVLGLNMAQWVLRMPLNWN
jgi:hypothetical protein